jgi:myo-inositol-1(or 4)-monophosphatase
MPGLDKEIRFARQTALAAGEILRRGQRKHQTFTLKGRVDLVTAYDLRSERLIIDRITRAFPHHAVLAEERGENHKQSRFRWVIDPLDGTTNFAHGYPAFCVSIGLEVDGEPALGVVYDPVHDELFHAVRGQGAFVNRRRIHVSEQKALSRSLLATGFPYDIAESNVDNLDNFARMYKVAQGIRRCGSAALDLCHVACGRFDGFWELKLHPWDVAAGMVIVVEAGGRVTDFHGHKSSIFDLDIIASNGRIHRQIQDILLRQRH